MQADRTEQREPTLKSTGILAAPPSCAVNQLEFWHNGFSFPIYLQTYPDRATNWIYTETHP